MLGYSQTRISKAETGAQRPSAEMQERIRNLAQGMGIRFDSNWFFEVPGTSDD